MLLFFRSTVLSALHPPKAPASISVIVAGMVMLESALQFLNASVWITVAYEGISMLFRFTQFSNMDGKMLKFWGFEMVSGNTTPVTEVQFLNIPSYWVCLISLHQVRSITPSSTSGDPLHTMLFSDEQFSKKPERGCLSSRRSFLGRGGYK